MATRIGTSRSKGRKLLKKSYRRKGKISTSRYFAEFKEGEKVAVKMESAVQKGACHIRFHGRTGVIMGKRGRCYNVEIRDGAKKKTLCMHPVHLKKI